MIFGHNFTTRNCSKLRRIHWGQWSFSLMIIKLEFKFVAQFVFSDTNLAGADLLLDQLIQILINQSLFFLHIPHETYAVNTCAFFLMTRKLIMIKWNFHRLKCEWKPSDKMCPRILKLPNLRERGLSWKGRNEAIGSTAIPRSRPSTNQLLILWISIILTSISIIQSWISIIRSFISIIQLDISRHYGEIVIDIQDWIMDVNN